MDHDKCAAPAATHMCRACAWSFSERIEMAGHDKPQRLRNYSHFVIGGKWHCLGKGQKREMQQILTHPPDSEWLGVIATSSQKHIIFRAPIAVGATACTIQLEEHALTYQPPALGRHMN
jgi:CRISPR type IV-associated protein Csf1